MGTGSGPLHRVFSAALLALACGAGALYVATPRLGGDGVDRAAGRGQSPAYHRPPDALREPGPCVGCHGPAPHRSRPGARAFLNLHVYRMECGVCHFRAADLTVRRLKSAGDRLAPGIGTGERWAGATWPDQAGGLRSDGPRCAECHRRGSPILAGGLYDAYRQRLLEELSLLYRVGPGGGL